MARSIKRLFTFRLLLTFLTVCSITALLLAYLSPFVHPNTLPFLPLFGLSYSIIVSINILFGVIWIIKKSRWSLIVLTVLLIGGNLHFRTFAIGSNEVNETSPELKVMSYNVRLFGLYNTIQTNNISVKDQIFSFLSKEQPDVVCFQEFYHQDKPTHFVTKDTLKSILQSVDYHERYASKMYGRQNFGIALFSKYPIIEKGNVNIETLNSTFNYCIYSDIVKEEDTFRIYNVHLQSIKLQHDDYALFNSKEETVAKEPSSIYKLLNKVYSAYPYRADQAEHIVKHIKNSPHPVIVCGDFNDTPLSYSYNQFNSLLTDAFRNTSKGIGKTYAGRIPAGRIDYIFHSPSLGSKDFKIQAKELSDHFAIECSVFKKEE